MPVSSLWAVDVYGRVYSLSTAGQQWEQCRDVHMEFKRVTAAQNCCWGIACDNKIYLNVHASDLPIRFKEDTYENQRWNPVGGFSDQLLASDRWQWSDVTGRQHQPQDSFRLPSNSWEWEGDWYVDENLEGQSTEKGGWTYALDFPRTYAKDKHWNSCVRRRRWLRHRVYKAMDSWAEIPTLEGDVPEPFSDLSCGGWELTEEPAGRLSLWAVTLQGKVFFREGICDINPEGSSWQAVDVQGEVFQISCGSKDLVWAVLWEGQLIVRMGISRDSPQGTSWCTVESPTPDVGVNAVSVGVNAVWAITKDNKVWFRRSVNSHNPSGSGWINMVGEMNMVSVGLNDQLWGIGSEDRAIYFRQGVTPSELSGKTWRTIVVPRDTDRSHSSASASSLQSAGCFFSGEVRAPSVASDVESDPEKLSADLACRAATGDAVTNPPGQTTDTPSLHIPKVTSDSFISELVSDREPGKSDGSPAPAIMEEATGFPEGEMETHVQAPEPRDPGWSNVDLEVAQTSSGVQDTGDACSLSSVATYTMNMEDQYGGEDHPLWTWISGGGCDVDTHSHLSWFSSPMNASFLSQPLQSMSLSVMPAQTAAWKKEIFEQLSERTKREMENFKGYEQAIEQSVWVKKGTMQWWRDWKPYKWVDVQFALEQFSGSDGNKDGILFVYYNFNEEKKYLHAFINEVTIMVPILNDAKHTFAVYTPERTKQRWPIRLAAATEQEMYDWLGVLSVSCWHSRGIQGPPSKQAIWSITCKGDIFVSDPAPALEAMPYPTPCDQMFWRQVGGHLRLIECNSLGIVWGIGYDYTAWVYTGGYGGSFFQGLASSTENIYTQTDVKSVYIYENQRWNPLTGYSDRGLPTDRFMWSDASGRREATKTGAKPPSPHWTWVSDWSVDHSVSGGADKDGWQYAADFPAFYHKNMTVKDFVRRRRYSRKCKLATTGPWKEVAPILLSDVSILPCDALSSVDEVPLWAISGKGEVLCRRGVTTLTPAGSSWLHVGTDQPFKSISIGAGRQVWTIAKDGSAFYRGSVSPENPAGDSWYQIASPDKQKLKQVSVGRTSVCAVDENGNLWYRQGVTPNYPKGSKWEHISTNVRKVSVGPLDQIWVIADKVQGTLSLSSGTVCHRLGVGPLEPRGSSWDYGIGGGWDHISVRGNSMEPPQIRLPSATSSLTPQSELVNESDA